MVKSWVSTTCLLFIWLLQVEHCKCLPLYYSTNPREYKSRLLDVWLSVKISHRSTNCEIIMKVILIVIPLFISVCSQHVYFSNLRVYPVFKIFWCRGFLIIYLPLTLAFIGFIYRVHLLTHALSCFEYGEHPNNIIWWMVNPEQLELVGSFPEFLL